MYQFPLGEQERVALNDMEAVVGQMRSARAGVQEDIDWDERLTRQRNTVLQSFLNDQCTYPDDYISASLPHLPFEDESFDICTSAHLLFAYSPRGCGGIHTVTSNHPDALDIRWHFMALMELMRVSRGDVRVYHANTMDPKHLLAGTAPLHRYVRDLMPLLPSGWTARLYRPFEPDSSTGLKMDASFSGLHLFKV
jgi:hypothetical protein